MELRAVVEQESLDLFPLRFVLVLEELVGIDHHDVFHLLAGPCGLGSGQVQERPDDYSGLATGRWHLQQQVLLWLDLSAF